MIPPPEIVDSKFVLRQEYIPCVTWTCPVCEMQGYAPCETLAEDVYYKHYQDEHVDSSQSL